MTTTKGPSPAFKTYENHKIQITLSTKQWEVSVGALQLASSNRALVLDESGYEPVIYFPRDDIVDSALRVTPDRSTCPFKGEAKYFSLAEPGSDISLAWSYAQTYDEVAEIEGYVAFYEDRVTILTNH